MAVGRLVIATDSSPRIVAIGDGVTAWNSLPKYYARSASQSVSTIATQSGITNVHVDRTGLTVTFTVGDIPWLVVGNEPTVYGTAPGGIPGSVIVDGANAGKAHAMGGLTSTVWGTSYFGSVPQVIERISIPGTYTRKLRVINYSNIGTLTFGYSDSTAYLRAFPEN